jgi:hypothetical protein
MKEAEIKDQILSELGAPVISVEIDPTQWCAIFKRSLRWFKAKKGLISCEIRALNPNQREYDLPANCNQVVDIFLPVGFGDIQSLYSQGILDTNLIPADFFGAGNYGHYGYGFSFSNSSYIQVLQYMETTRRVISAEPNWEVVCDKIIISGSRFNYSTMGNSYMLINFKKQDISIDEIVLHRDEDLIYRYSLAIAKMLLGRIRSKYKSYPAAGGMIDTDGPDLIEEAKAEIEKLEEEISDSQFPMGVVIG